MATILLPRKMLVGAGSVSKIASVLSGFGFSRPLIVADPFYSPSRLQHFLPTLHVHEANTFFDIVPDPTTSSIDRLVRKLKAGNFDSMVSIGGGSAMDTCKAAGVLALHGGKMSDYKVPRVVDDLLPVPLICVPTTAGTGSEVTRFTIVTDESTQEKMLCAGSAFLPLAAVVDYELTLTCPYRLTADSGIDALCHAMEAFVSRKANKFSDALGLSAINRIAKSLRAACDSPGNVVAREEMMIAATEAGMAFSNSSVTLIHGMSRPIGALFHVPHGLSNALLASIVTNYSVPGAVQRYAQVARAAEFAPLMGMSDEDCAARMASGLSALCAAVQVPKFTALQPKLTQAQFEQLVPKMAADALASGSPNNNPLVPTKAEIEQLYRDMWSGKAFA